MENFIYPGVLSSFALLVYYFTLLQAGLARAKYNIKAPSHDGPEEYVRKVRVHHNTIEHLVLFLPGLWLFSFAVDPIWAFIIGLVWPIGRLKYAFDYYKDAEKRGPGRDFSIPPIYNYVLGALSRFRNKIDA